MVVLAALEGERREIVVVGAVYFALHLASVYASRRSHDVSEHAGGEEEGSRLLWKVALLLYVGLIPLLFLEWYYVAIAGFLSLYLLQNLWRPIQVTRFDAFGTEERGATVLSIESQAKALATMIVAPVLGLAVDSLESQGIGGEFWPVAALGAAAALGVLLATRRGGVAAHAA
jgi:hypothetical protein